MKRLLLLMVIVFSVHCSIFAASDQTNRIFLYQNERRSGKTNVWWLTGEKLKTLETWDARKEKVPLSLDRAIEIASKWIDSRESGKCQIEKITIKPIRSGEGRLSRIFYYQFDFYATRMFDFAACIVLMDGTVLEPETHYLRLPP